MTQMTRLPASLVTGAAGGLGFAIASRLASRGDHVVIADVDGVSAAARASELVKGGASAEGIALDVTDESAVASVFERIEAERPVGTVVNNAGIAFSSPLVDTDLARFDALMGVNVRGTFVVMQAAARHMLPRGVGSIVNVCSTSSFTASTGPMAAYDASKAAVALLTKAAARELAPLGLRVNGVAPGTMDTALVRGLGSSDADLDSLAAARIPLGRLGETGEVANAVAWLSSPEASYVVGHLLVVDGGWLA
jgi:NAD(P)-dependent dehydrogenase (short-subunit alcohol dehydrogenase family)